MPCKIPLCCFVPKGSGYCWRHDPKKEKATYVMPKVSKRRVKDNRILAGIVKELLEERPICEMNVPGVCSKRSTTVHHTAGRVGALLLDKKYMMAACSSCNLWEVSHPNEAIEMGLKISRLNK